MSKKLGIILMFVGGYTTLIGGLTWVMNFVTIEQQALVRPYDWAWGLLTAIILIIGCVVAAKGYILGLIGFGIELLGIAGNIWLISFGISQQHFFPVIVFIGTIISATGLVVGLIFHILRMVNISKHGNSLLN